MTESLTVLAAKRYARLLAPLILLMYLLFPSQLLGQSDTLVNWVVGNGGGKVVGSGYIVQSTLGQPCVGVVSGAGFRLSHGTLHDTCGIMWLDVLDHFEQVSDLPTSFRLGQNYPNPFNPTTTIRFTLPKRSQAVLSLFNILGQKVYTVLDKELSAGEYEVQLNADDLATGIYFYRLVAGDFSETKKLMLLK